MLKETANTATVVTCFYQLDKSKHPLREYHLWIDNFLSNVHCNLVIYTDGRSKNYLRSVLKKNPGANCLLIEKELDELYISRRYPDIWNDQEQLDPDKECGRGQDCYKIWNSKFWFLKETINLNPFDSDKYIWNDIGNVRDPKLIAYVKRYPVYEKISKGKLDVVLLREFGNEDQFFYQNENHFSGSIFGGGREVILELFILFHLYFDLYIGSHKFIGCDQQILSTMYRNHKEKFNVIRPPDKRINRWFYLYAVYSDYVCSFASDSVDEKSHISS